MRTVLSGQLQALRREVRHETAADDHRGLARRLVGGGAIGERGETEIRKANVASIVQQDVFGLQAEM